MTDGDETTPGDKAATEAQSGKYDQAFFLDLAAKGKDAWNAWRRDPADEGVRVTFAGIDFSKAPRDKIDFSEFEFGDHADFSGCKWRGLEGLGHRGVFEPGCACFVGAAFGDYTSFDSAAFGTWANFFGTAFGDKTFFTDAAFGEGVLFCLAAFGNSVVFTGAVFDYLASFAGATFGEWADFTAATFGENADFTGTTFGNRALFTGAAFGDVARFDDTFFKGSIELTGQSEEEWRRGLENVTYGVAEEFRVALTKRHEDSWKHNSSGPDRFVTISFERTRFSGQARFSGRSFEQIADFTDARFYYPPDFSDISNAAKIDFTGAHIGFVPPGKLAWTDRSEVPIRLRALRKIAEETKNHDLERDLYIEERKAERGVYLHQLLGLDELKKILEDINEQKKHVWLEWRLQRTARNAHWLRILAKPAKLRGFSRNSSGSLSWASIGRLPIMAAALCGLSCGSL